MGMKEKGVGRPDSKCAHVMRVHSSNGGLCPFGRESSVVVGGGFNKRELDGFLVDTCRINNFAFLELQNGISVRKRGKNFGGNAQDLWPYIGRPLHELESCEAACMFSSPKI